MSKYLFGNYVLDVDERKLLRDNREIRLRGKLFDTLCVLVENAGKLVHVTGDEPASRETVRRGSGARSQRMELICPFPRRLSVPRGKQCQWVRRTISNSNDDPRLNSGSKFFAQRGLRALSRRSLFRSMFTKAILSMAMLANSLQEAS